MRVSRFALLISFLLSGCAHQDHYPQGPIHIVVPHDPGGVVDTSARLIQPHLQKYLGVPVVIDNMPGAGGNIGRAYVFRQPPDGYTLMVNLQPSMSAGQIVTGARFDSLQFTHIYNITGHNYDAVAVPIGSSLKTIEDIRKASQSRPLTTAGGGIGTTNYILAMLLKEKAGVQISFVPFNSGAGTALAISGGQTEIGIAALDSLWPLYLVLGLVLGNLVEANFHRSLLIGRGSYAIFFTRPIALSILVLTVVALAWSPIKRLTGGK